MQEDCLSNVKLDVPHISRLTKHGSVRTRSLPWVPTDPACIHAATLMAVSHYCLVQKLSLCTIDLLQLKDMAMSEVRNAMTDCISGATDQLIAAVVISAAYEALFGDPAIFHTHMQGLTRMINLRNDLSLLGLYGALRRVILWIGSDACYSTGGIVYSKELRSVVGAQSNLLN
jgi:hypothetical protein